MASEARAAPDSPVAGNSATAGIIERSRQVWLALAVCLVGFVGLCALSSYGLVSFLSNVAVPKAATLEAPEGAGWAVLRHGSRVPEQVSGNVALEEGDTVSVGKDGKGFIRLLDDSTVHIFPNSIIRLDRHRTNEFFGRAQEVRLSLEQGIARVARGEPQQGYTDFILATDLAEVEIDPNSAVRVAIEDGDERMTQVVVESGQATFHSLGEEIDLGRQQMAWVSNLEEPQGPVVAEIDLVENGDFTEGAVSPNEFVEEGGLGVTGWLPIRDAGAASVPAGSVIITDELELRAARILYEGNEGEYPRVGIVQQVNEPTEFYDTIELSATVKLVEQEQAVRGAGVELYPLIVKVLYLDSDGHSHEWRRSFYISGDPEDLTDLSRIQLPVGKWESTDEIREIRQATAEAEGRPDVADQNAELFTLKSPANPLDMAEISTIEIYGTGSSFQSWATGISLLAR